MTFRLSRSFTLFFVFGLAAIGLLHYLGVEQEFNSSVWWYDVLLHFLGGFVVAGSAYLFFGLERKTLSQFSVLFILASVFVAGVLWEIAQMMDNIPAFVGSVVGSTGGLADTFKDMVMDMLGGTAFLFAIRTRDKNRARKFNKWVNAKSLEKERR